MSDGEIRLPLLDLFYQRYLDDENSARYIRSISRNYTVATLEKLARMGDCLSRRAAVLAIGFLGDFSNNEVMGEALVDCDRAVRLLADHGIRQIWQRQGSGADQQALQQLYRYVGQNRLEDAIEFATDMLEEAPELGEVWNQRAIAFCGMGNYRAAIEDCQETLRRNPFHFPSAMGMGHCCLQVDEAVAALDSFRLALSINPDLEGVRVQISQLERTLGI